ncbi:MAG: ABC transporter permease subunit [Ruminococcaceae bacterium]|nr:ABC transporter permease subunit [Oscillospiraceae bacterium]
MKKRLFTLFSVIVWLLVWQICAAALNEKILLPSPITVAGRLAELVPQFDFIKSIGFTLGRILIGFFIGVTIGTALAALSGKVRFIRTLFAPLISAMKSIPVASFTILALIWVSSRNLSVLISVLIAIPIVYSNMLEGIDCLDPKLKTMAEVFEIPKSKRFVGIYLSQLLPYFRSASKLAMGLCWKSGVAAEVIGIPDGSIGERLYMSKMYLETEDLFAWTLVIILLSFLCEKLFMLLVGLIVRRIERM